MNKEKGGFTLIELLVVIAIIGLLMSIVLVNLSSVKARARDARRISNLRSIYPLLEMYYLDNGVYPNCSAYGDCVATEEAGYTADTTQNGTFMAFLNSYNNDNPLPLDPLNNDQYYFFYNTGEYPTGSNKCWYFCMGTKLENLNNPVLQTDSDVCPTPGTCMWDLNFFKICRYNGPCT